jgi:hypothetical protein
VATIRDLVRDLDAVPPETDRYEIGPSIFATRPMTPDSEAVLLREDFLESPTHPGFRYVLDVSIAREVLAVWSAWRGGARPSDEQAASAVIHYAQHDAYQPVGDG